MGCAPLHSPAVSVRFLPRPNTNPETPPPRLARAAATSKEVQQWRDEDLPWYEANLQISSQTLRLHNEIVEINNLLRPVPAEDAQRLEAKGLRPVPPADRIALLRRATYDLTGLPPTPSEVDAPGLWLARIDLPS